MTVPQSPHDKLFTAAFGTRQAARGMLQTLLPKSILAKVDLGTLAPAPGSFVDEALAGSQSDLLFSVKLAGRPALIYVLLEHKSYHDPWVALQLLRYVTRIWEKSLREEPPPTRLPPVVPLVVYHGESGWNVSTRLEDIIDPVVGEVAELAQLTPRFEFLVDDLNQTTDEQILSRATGLFAALAAIFMRDARREGKARETLQRVGSLLAELLQAPDGRRAVAILLRYLCLVAKVDAAEVTEVVKDIHPEAEKLMMTIAEQLLQQGREEGRAEALRGTLLRQLRLRFQDLPEDALARIEAATSEQLDLWTERILTAETLDEVLAD